MLTILLNQNKDLVISKMAKIYQGDNLADILAIVLPKDIGDIQISDETNVEINIIDAGNILHSFTLSIDDEYVNDDFLRYKLPIDSELTRIAGALRISLNISSDSYVLNTNKTSITVEPVDIRIFVSEPPIPSV